MIRVTQTKSTEAYTFNRRVAGVVLTKTTPVGTPLFMFLSEDIQRLAQSANARHPGDW